jgi:hypothetical protein
MTSIPSCARCGDCCRNYPCTLGLAVYGLHDGPCKALRRDAIGRWECSIYADSSEELKKSLSIRLGIGFGCLFRTA